MYRQSLVVDLHICVNLSMLNKLQFKFREKQFKCGNQIDVLESLHKQKRLFAWGFAHDIYFYLLYSTLQYT